MGLPGKIEIDHSIGRYAGDREGAGLGSIQNLAEDWSDPAIDVRPRANVASVSIRRGYKKSSRKEIPFHGERPPKQPSSRER